MLGFKGTHVTLVIEWGVEVKVSSTNSTVENVIR